MIFRWIRYRPNKRNDFINIFNFPLILTGRCLVYLDIRKIFFKPQSFHLPGKEPLYPLNRRLGKPEVIWALKILHKVWNKEVTDLIM